MLVVEAVKHPNVLYITVEGASPDVVGSAEARKLAYAARLTHGFENAGIEALGGPYNVDGTEKAGEEQAIRPLVDAQRTAAAQAATDHVAALVYRQQYKITRSLF